MNQENVINYDLLKSIGLLDLVKDDYSYYYAIAIKKTVKGTYGHVESIVIFKKYATLKNARIALSYFIRKYGDNNTTTLEIVKIQELH